MFKECVSTALNTPAANLYYNRIFTTTNIQPDATLVATARALVFPRMEDDDRLSITYFSKIFRKNDVAAVGSEAPDYVIGRNVDPNNLCIINYTSVYESDNDAAMDAMEKFFPDCHPDFHRVEKVTVFFSKQFRVLCYICPEKRSAVLFTTNINVRQYHYLQCAIPAFLPWFFSKEQGISEEERELIDSLREKTPDHYLACVRRCADKTDMQSSFVRGSLCQFESAFEQSQKQRVAEQISDINHSINDLNDRIAEYVRELRQKQAYLFGLENMTRGDGDSELMEYFLSNKKLELIGTEGTHIRFYAADRLMYFDDEAAERLIEKSGSYLYKPNGISLDSYIKHGDLKRLYTEIFVKKRLFIRVGAALDFAVDGRIDACTVRGGPFTFSYMSQTDAAPNPHLYYHNCFGGYQSTINSLIRDRNYVGALEQCIASVKSLNLLESLTTAPFIKDLITGNIQNRCIELPDGSIVTPKEAVAFLKKEEQQNGEACQTDGE